MQSQIIVQAYSLCNLSPFLGLFKLKRPRQKNKCYLKFSKIRRTIILTCQVAHVTYVGLCNTLWHLTWTSTLLLCRVAVGRSNHSVWGTLDTSRKTECRKVLQRLERSR